LHLHLIVLMIRLLYAGFYIFMIYKDISGKVFNRLTAISVDESKKSKSRGKYWLCQCICGKTTSVQLSHLQSGRTKSCGCLKLEKPSHTTHGMSRSREHGIWRGMKDRCHNQKNTAYHHYGEKGITVCDRWRNSFESFIEDMGLAPSNLHSIEREKNELGYSKDNCVWATAEIQANNKSTNRIVTYKGATYTAAQLCRKLSIDYHRFFKRINRLKWHIDNAVFFDKVEVNALKNIDFKIKQPNT
jgi:hypothetical protein